MSVVKTKRIIYELEDELLSSRKTISSQVTQKPLVLVHKLGIATYIKWGTIYNYHFSFDLNKGRLVCYKQAKSKHPNNHYSLIQGQFIECADEVQKKEKMFQKKKNYQAPPFVDDLEKSIVYVKTKKGKTFRLVLNEGENQDKVIGYLQMCFSSKSKSESKGFFAMLGVGVIKVNDRGYKLNTGILVSLDNWQPGAQSCYLKDQVNKSKNPAQKIGQLVNNYLVIGAIVSAFKPSILSLIFNPDQQTVDVILFDETNSPSQFLYQIFFLLKNVRKSISQSEAPHLSSQMRLQSQSEDTINKLLEYVLVGENKSVSIFCKKCYISLVGVDQIQSSMKASISDEDQLNDPEEEKEVISDALSFYKRALGYYPQIQQIINDTKEFILVNPYKLQSMENIEAPVLRNFLSFDQSKDYKPVEIIHSRLQTLYTVPDEQCIDQIQQPLIQETKLMNVQMQRNKNGYLTPRQPSTPDNRPNFNTPELIQKSPFSNQVLSRTTIKSPAQVQQFENQEQNQELSGKKDPVFQQVEEEDDGEVDNIYDEEAVIVKAGKGNFPTQQIKGYKNIMKYAIDFEWIAKTDEYRVPIAHKSGGTACLDKNIVNLTRSVGKSMIKEIGRKIISGNFNLTTISFPIIAMIPCSALEKIFMSTILFPLYINMACQSQDPVQRIKLVIVATLSNFIQGNTFLKPLNPVVGETFEGSYDDGTQLYAEQISHHPPVSYFFSLGPKQSYKYWGYYLYEAKAGLNSLVLENKGKRFLQFQDGQKICIDFNQEQFSGTFMGTMKHESLGSITFKDEKNGLIGTINFGKVKKRPSDYVDGEIKQGQKVVAKLYGSYLGFLDWDGQRYWDARYVLPFRMKVEQSQMESDHSKRTDKIMMIKGDMKQAQDKKEYLETLQRSDTKLRKENEQIFHDKKKKK